MNINILQVLGIFFLTLQFTYSQNYGDFKNENFPVHLIDNTIIEKRQLSEKMVMLKDSCNWTDRIGKKIDLFWLQTEKANLFGHVYEYFMDCDNLRLIYWQADPNERGEILDFMIEPLEEDSQFVVLKRKYLKNKKRYKKYID